jgi:hypothetical protein
MEHKTQIHAEDGKQDLTITREFDLPVESGAMRDQVLKMPRASGYTIGMAHVRMQEIMNKLK